MFTDKLLLLQEQRRKAMHLNSVLVAEQLVHRVLRRRQEVFLQPRPADPEAEAGHVLHPQDGDHEPVQAGWKC